MEWLRAKDEGKKMIGFVTWRGISIKELSREELIEALEFASSELARRQTSKAIRAHALGSIEMLKRGE